MFEIFKKKLEQKKIKKYLDNEDAETYELLCNISNKSDDLLKKWSDMIIKHSKIKIIKSATEKDFEQKYNEFMNAKRNASSKRLGSVYAMIEPTILYKDGLLICSIKYVEFELKNGFLEDDYYKAINEYEQYLLKYNSLYDEYKYIFSKVYNSISDAKEQIQKFNMKVKEGE